MTESAASRQSHDVPACELSPLPSPGNAGAELASQIIDFSEIFEREFHYVWHALRRLGVRDRDLEDLTHDVLLAVYQRLDRYDASRPLRPWLFGFAFRIASDYRRRSGHQLEVVGESFDATDQAPNALEQTLRRETADLARRALDMLELGRRAVFILHELDEFAMPEVAAALEIPLNTAYSRLRLARAELAAAAGRLRARGLP